MSRVLFWDFDGTLGSDPENWSGVLVRVIKELDPETRVTVEKIAPHLRTGYPWHSPQHSHLHIKTADAWWENIFHLLEVAATKAGLPRETAVHAARRVRNEYLNPARFTVFADVRPALSHAKAHGWRNVVLSNHTPELGELVCALGLDDFIEQTITSAQVGYEKPHVELFRRALTMVGGATEAWMISDNLLADVLGAQEAGLSAVLVRRPSDSQVLYSEDLLGAVALILKGNPS